MPDYTSQLCRSLYVSDVAEITSGTAAATSVGWYSSYLKASSGQVSSLDRFSSWLCRVQTSSTPLLL